MRLLEHLKLPVWLVLTFYWIALISSTWVTQTLALHLSTTSLWVSPIFGWASLMAQTVKNLPAMQEIQVRFLGQEDPLEGNGNPLQYPCLENFMDRGARRATVHGLQRVRQFERAHTTPYTGISKTAVRGRPTLNVLEWQS